MDRPSYSHVLCGTCMGEFERRCGYFESGNRRSVILGLQKVNLLEKEYCCNCGAEDNPQAVFRLALGSNLCDGLHEAVIS